MSTFVHHGLIYVPLGYKTSLHLLGDVQEVRGGSPWGAGVIAGTVGKEPSPTEKEVELANIQGEGFWNALAKVKFEE
jgi:NAD(P)H dehydrogenase (quinone)